MINFRLLAVFMISFRAICLNAEESVSFDSPKILPRSAWQAPPEDHRSKSLQPMGTVRHVSVHHTAVDKLRGDGTPEAELQIIQRGHRDDNQWGDIAYHFLIAPDGRIFEGRSTEYAPNSGTRYLSEEQWRDNSIFTADEFERDPANVGVGGTTFVPESTTGPRPGNVAGHITICFLGNFMGAEPTDAAKKTFIPLCAYLLRKHNLVIEDVWLHREVASTLCPGNVLYAWLRSYPKEERYSLGSGLTQVQALLDNKAK